jgi:hypothetical protein
MRAYDKARERGEKHSAAITQAVDSVRRRKFGLGQVRLLNLLTRIFRLVDPRLPLPPLSIISILQKDDRQRHILHYNAKAAS